MGNVGVSREVEVFVCEAGGGGVTTKAVWEVEGASQNSVSTRTTPERGNARNPYFINSPPNGVVCTFEKNKAKFARKARRNSQHFSRNS